MDAKSFDTNDGQFQEYPLFQTKFVRNVVRLLGSHQDKMVFDRAPLGVHVARKQKQPLGSRKVVSVTASATS